MSNKFARPVKTWGHCARSGRRMLLRDMVPDGYLKGLLVDPNFYEPEHPQEMLPPVTDAIAVKRPAPDLDRPKTVVTFPTYDLKNDRINSAFTEHDYLGTPSVAAVANASFLWITDTSDWLQDDNGNKLMFSP